MDSTAFHSVTRRKFLSRISALSAAGLAGLPVRAATEPSPEISRIRLVKAPAICLAPQHLAEELLRLEGFSHIDYVEATSLILTDMVQNGDADITMEPSTALVYSMDRHESVVTLAGVHAGCYEVFGGRSVNALRDLKGKTVGVYALGGGDHILMSSMLAYVGIDPQKEVSWVTGEENSVRHRVGAMQLFMDGKIDAFVGFAPQPHELRARKIGKVLVNTAVDRPWSQYYCCMLTANRGFVSRYPVATKRALRALLKATDLCAQQPERVARRLAETGIEARYDVSLEVLKELPYGRWRDADPEDTLRFHSLRLHEVGMLKSTPQNIIAHGTDWRFLNELKRELKT